MGQCQQDQSYTPEAGYPGLPLEYKKALDKKACCEGKKSGSA